MNELKKVLKKQGKVFLHGLMVMVPAIVTIWIIVLTIDTLDQAMRTILGFGFQLFLNSENRLVRFVTSEGVGLVITLLVIYLAGIAAGVWFLRDPMRQVEKLIDRVPVIKSIYSAIRDLLRFMGDSESESRGRPCVITTEDGTVRMLGLLTQQQPERFLPEEEQERIGVYLPMSYQIGGFTVYVPRDRVEIIDDMNVEELFKLCMMAGLSSNGPEGGIKSHGQPTGPEQGSTTPAPENEEHRDQQGRGQKEA